MTQKQYTDAELWRGNRDAQRAQRDALQRAALAIETYKASPWVKPQHIVQAELKELLSEVDPYAIQHSLDLRGWDVVGGDTGYTTDERQCAVDASIWLYRYSPLGQWTIWLWTSWGMGDKVRVSIPDNDKANEAIDEFWTADRNAAVLGDDNIKELSRWLLVRGNRFFIFSTSTVDGLSTIRVIKNQSEMQPLYNPHDSTDVWFYKRTWTVQSQGVTGTEKTAYYPDWTTYFAGDKTDDETPDINERWDILVKAKVVTETDKTIKKWDADGDIGDGDEMPKTDFYIYWVRHNIKDEDDSWGWPILTAARAWLGAHQTLMEGRLTLAKAASMYWQSIEVEGGSRAVNKTIGTIRSNLSQDSYYDTNPAATSGSTQVHNKAVTPTTLPLTTGASDTATDNKTFSWMASLGGGVFPTSMGLDTSRWATALQMNKAQAMIFETYKNFWSAQFKRIARIVLMALEKNKKGVNYGDYTVVVNIDTFSLADFPAIASAVGGFVRDTITPLVSVGAIPTDAAMAIMAKFYKMALDALGVEGADILTDDEAFKLGDFAEPEPEVDAEPPGVEDDEDGEEEPATAVERVLENLREGAITPEIVRGYLAGELGDMVE